MYEARVTWKNMKQTGLTKIPRCKYTFFPNSPRIGGDTIFPRRKKGKLNYRLDNRSEVTAAWQ